MLGRYPPAERCIHIVVDLSPCIESQIVGDRIILEIEFGPDNKVYDLLVETVGPVIVEYLEVPYIRVLIQDLRSKNRGQKPYRDR